MENLKVLMLFVALCCSEAICCEEKKIFNFNSAAAQSGGGAIHTEAEKIFNGSDKAIFLLAGQSNMVGRGGTYNVNETWDGVTPCLCQPNPRILRLNSESEMLWEEAREPLFLNISRDPCPVGDRKPGIGPGMPFANTLLARNPTIGTIGLVPCAVGNTNISQWMPGSCLYNRLLTRARASLREGGSIRGMLWYQGENDRYPGLAEVYEGKLKDFFNSIRNDLMLPSPPIIQVALDMPENDTYVKMVRNAQLELKLKNLKTVDALGLPLNGDNVHLTTDSQVKLGSKLAKKFLKYFK